MTTEKDILNLIAMTKLIHSENDFRRIPLEVEHTLMNQIREGKYKEIHLASFDKINTNLGYMAEKPFTQCLFLTVSATAPFLIFLRIWDFKHRVILPLFSKNG